MRTTRTRALGVLVAALFAASCGGDDDSSDEAATNDTSGEEPTASPDDGDGDVGTAIDACSLLSEDEAAEVLGGPIIESGPTTGVGESVCFWEIEGDWSITVSVGSPRTAPGGKFEPVHLFGDEPEPVAGMDAAWHVGLGTVDFAAAGRKNSIQVVSPSAGGADPEAAAELAAVLQGRLG